MNQVTVRLPFTEEWLTFWGGDTPELNHHHGNDSQRYAFDFIQVDQAGSFFRTDGATNEDYFSFGKPIIAPADGVVIEAVDGLRDNIPGLLNSYMFLGNYVMVQHSEHEFYLLGHLRCGSVQVVVGDTVVRGQKLGECGNSGYSSDPHLHFQVQNSATFAELQNYEKTSVAKGVKTYFSDIVVRGNDQKVRPMVKHSPIKGEFVSPGKKSKQS